MPQGSVTILDADRITWTTRLLTEVCCNCHMPFAMPEGFQRAAREDPAVWFYCPRGHQQHYTDDPLARAKRERDAAKRRAEQAEATARRERGLKIGAQRQASAYKGVATRQRNRIARGVCPCCNRYFRPMAAHMASKHPQYAGEPLVPDGG